MKKKELLFISNLTLLPFMNDVISNIYPDLATEVKYIQVDSLQDPDSAVQISNADIVVVWVDFIEKFMQLSLSVFKRKLAVDSAVKEISMYCDYIKNYVVRESQGIIIWIGFENSRDFLKQISNPFYIGYDLCRQINMYLVQNYCDNMYIINLEQIVYKIGNSAYDLKRDYRWGCPYSDLLLEAVISSIPFNAFFNKEKETNVKCVVVDCDNVLWGGIIQEQGISEIKLGNLGIGRLYLNFQRQLSVLYDLGIILAIISKNDYAVVERVFCEHKEMELSLDMFASIKVNWCNKVDNLKQISEEINIDLEQMLFIDDSEYEINAVNSCLPVKTRLFDVKKWTAMDFGIKVYSKIDFNSAFIRQKTYRNRKRDNNLLDELQPKTIENVRISIDNARESEYGRISELSLRTNKATNGKRFRVNQVRKAVLDNKKVYSVYASDSLADLGLIGAIICNDRNIELFCISCRAFGRGVDEHMKKFIEEKHVEIETCEFCETGKNKEFCKFIREQILDI